MLNVSFQYAYRDVHHYKLHGEATFTNQCLLPLAEIEKQIRGSTRDGLFFIARQVQLEERFFDVLREDDHPWHEFEAVKDTNEPPFDPVNWNEHRYRRDIVELLAEFHRAAHAGWDELNVRADLRQLLERQKAEQKQQPAADRDSLTDTAHPQGASNVRVD